MTRAMRQARLSRCIFSFLVIWVLVGVQSFLLSFESPNTLNAKARRRVEFTSRPMGMHTYRQLITKESESTLTTLEPNSDVEAMDAKHDKDRKRFFIETHGCQMNLADSDVVRAVLLSVNYEICDVLEDADLILINTCAIRENAEAKIWQRLRYFRSLKRKRKALLREMKKKGMIDVSDDSEKKAGGPDGPTVGVLGCMAERLKDRMLEEEEVDFIAGPDAYRDLPSLLRIVSTDSKAANVQLSLEETYSDIQPVRLAEGNVHAFVSIQRGCDNHCAFCVVPFTRGRERSRPVQSIVEEVRALSKQGIREVVLLGQNVNSYRDRSAESTLDADIEGVLDTNAGAVDERNLAEGFSERPRPRRRKQETSTMTDEIEDDDDRPAASAITFAQLLEAVAEVDPEMRIRFQSPHPKDFTDDLLHVIARLPNVCRSLHMPAQHGSTTALERMKRGYTREAYDALIQRARQILAPDSEDHIGLGISTDMIAGFCGEEEAEHVASVDLMKSTGYDQAFTYSYSKREQTFAGFFLEDDVAEETKARRLTELIDTFQSTAQERNRRLEVGRLHLVLVESQTKPKNSASSELGVDVDDDKNTEDFWWTGRTDTNKRVVFPDFSCAPHAKAMPNIPVINPTAESLLEAAGQAFYRMYKMDDQAGSISSEGGSEDTSIWTQSYERISGTEGNDNDSEDGNDPASKSEVSLPSPLPVIGKGSYAVVAIVGGRGHTLRGIPLAVTTLQHAHSLNLPSLRVPRSLRD